MIKLVADKAFLSKIKYQLSIILKVLPEVPVEENFYMKSLGIKKNNVPDA